MLLHVFHKCTRTALFERTSRQTLRTETDRISVVVLAQGVQTARIGHARIGNQYLMATNFWISLISRKARTLRLMVTGDALRVFSAVILNARIDTLSVESIAVLMRRTVLVVLTDILSFFY